PDRAGDSVRAALSALRDYHRWTRVLPAAAALERVLEDTGFLAFAATTPGGVDAGDVLHAVDRVRLIVEEGGSLADAADALDADEQAASEVESLPLEPGRTDVVRVMNLHKAKGLDAHVEAERPYCTAEDDRLFYVAATRARSMLIVSRTVEKPRNPAWGALNAY